MNHPNDPSLRSFIDVHADSHFPIQNLPYGVFTSAQNTAPHVGVALGDWVVDVSQLESAGLLAGIAPLPVFQQGSLNALMAQPQPAWNAMRQRISELLRHDSSTLRDHPTLRSAAFLRQRDVQLHLPFHVAGYTDFYASKEHATNVGTMFRDPANALLPNWLHIPIGYNGRASTVVVSGTPIRRPNGQLKPPNQEQPIFAPCRKLDFELELGAVVGTPNPMGTPLTVAQAEANIFGYVLLNDWSARDIQQWEYVPLGPFQAKVFASSISPWVVTAAALAPFRCQGPAQDPAPLPYLQQAEPRNLDIHLEVSLTPAEQVTASQNICRTNYQAMYWSSAQQLAHHASGGCAMQTGDLLGSGTISGSTPDSFGSLLELTWNGQRPLQLGQDIARSFIEDGDTVTMTGWCKGHGYRLGFGEVTGTILPALTFLTV